MQAKQNRREAGRLLCAELVELCWMDSSGRHQRRIANLEDISLSGACLQIENQIPVGTAVSVHYGDGQLLGTVRYCRYEVVGYFAGIELVEGCRWSSKHYQPEHLLDPAELLERTLERHKAKI